MGDDSADKSTSFRIGSWDRSADSFLERAGKILWGLVLVCILTIVGTSLALGAEGSHSSQIKGLWQWPTETPVSVIRGFDPPAKPWLPGHRGVDLDAPIGSTVLAPAPGVVAFAGKVVDRELVSIQHSGVLRSTYEPLVPLVVEGQVVERGDPIGLVDSGHYPGNLHWGARIGSDQYIDPMRMLVGPSILKPWDK